jgi:hypothetical protein
MIYPPNAVWSGKDPPQPSYLMHQLPGLDNQKGPYSLNNIVSKLNDSSCVALGWAGKPLSRKSRKRSNRPL